MNWEKQIDFPNQPKKARTLGIRQKKKLEMWKNEPFFLFADMNLFYHSSVSKIKKTIWLQKYFHGNTSFCDPHIEAITKNAIEFEVWMSLIWCCNPISSKNTSSTLSFRAQDKAFNLYKNILLKSWCFSALRQNREGPINPKFADNLDVSRKSNWFSCATRDLIFSLSVLIENLRIAKNSF